MKKWERDLQEAARVTLWEEREVILPHVFEHRCAVTGAVAKLCERAGWGYLSYVTAIMFDDRCLITEV